MYKFIPFLFAILASLYGYAQEKSKVQHFDIKVVYDARFLGDSTATRVYEEPCYLFVGDSGSLTESGKSFMEDKETALDSQQEIKMERVVKGITEITWAVLKMPDYMKTFDSFSVIKEDRGDIRFQYREEAQPLNWELADEGDSINGIYCQKATVLFGQRQWTAWFAPGIPISDGPYKFSGLPGLVVELYDHKRHFHFKLRDIERHEGGYSVPMTVFSDYVDLRDKEAFFKQKRYYQENYIEIREATGMDYMNAENRAAIRETAELGFKQRSNWIELYP